MAGASLAAVIAFGAALVSKAESPTLTRPSGSGANDSANFAVISHGEAINVSEHVDPSGGYTVFLFGADW